MQWADKSMEPDRVRAWLIACALSSLVAWLGWQLATDLAANGAFLYTTDDAYIHLAMARNLAAAHTYGVTPGVFASASSSPLWTLLLGLLLAVTPVGWHMALPFALGTACAGAALGLVLAALTRARHGIRCWQAAALALLAVVLPGAMGLPTLVFDGMEHSLQLLLTIAWALRMADFVAGRRGAGLLYALAVVMPLVRLESLASIGLGAIVLFMVRRPRQALAVLALAATSVLAEGAWGRAHGESWLPNAVLIKVFLHMPRVAADGLPPAAGGSAPTAPAAVLRLATRLGRNLAHTPGVLASFLALLGLALARRRRGRLARDEVTVVALAVGTWLVQSALSDGGPTFTRYARYLGGFGLFALAWLAADLLRPQKLAWRTALAHGALLAGLTGLHAGVLRREAEVGAHSQALQVQMAVAHFLASYQPHGTVAVEDLGAIVWLRPAPVLDVYGLATWNVARRLIRGTLNAEATDALAKASGVRVAALADPRSAAQATRPARWRPATWQPAGWFSLDAAQPRAARRVGLFAVVPAEWPALRAALARESAALASGVHIELAPDDSARP